MAEVGRLRHRLSAEHDHDARMLVEHSMRIEERRRDRRISIERPAERKEAA